MARPDAPFAPPSPWRCENPQTTGRGRALSFGRFRPWTETPVGAREGPAEGASVRFFASSLTVRAMGVMNKLRDNAGAVLILLVFERVCHSHSLKCIRLNLSWGCRFKVD